MTGLRSTGFAWTIVLACATVVSSCGKTTTAPPSTSGSGGSAGSSPGGSGGGTGGGPASGGASGTGGAATGGGGGAGGAAGSAGGGGGAGMGGAGMGGAPADAAGPADPQATVVIFLIDGLQSDAARTAAANGAVNLKLVIDGGVTVTDAHSTSSAARTTLPTSSTLLWGNATSGNVAVHTGTHVFEAGPEGMDDIFTAARAAGMKSVFSGGDNNYSGLTTADFHYASTASSDQMIVQNAINHLRNDKVRVIRIHLQRLRDDWNGPAGKTDPTSAYLRHIVANDALLGQLIQALKDEGVWEKTLLVVTADHGMGQAAGSIHPPSVRSSWDIFMAFYGPGVKKGATIPYAELPDVAVTAAKFLGLPPLKGHTATTVSIPVKGTTGTVLDNIFVGAPDDIAHPRYIDQYLRQNTFPMSADDYLPYRAAMLMLIR